MLSAELQVVVTPGTTSLQTRRLLFISPVANTVVGYMLASAVVVTPFNAVVPTYPVTERILSVTVLTLPIAVVPTTLVG